MPKSAAQLRDDEIQELYAWVDQVPLSRPKRNFTRDFSDGVLFAETVNYFFPRLVEVHNYSAANAFSQKMYNWQTLNKKVMSRIKVILTQQEMEDCANCVPFAMEKIMLRLQERSKDKAPPTSAVPVPRTTPPSSASRRPPSAVDVYDAPATHGGRGDSRLQLRSPQKAAPSPRPIRHLAAERQGLQREVDTEILVEKEQTIQDLRETVDILETKIKKLEQLLRLKDAKIFALTAKIDEGH